MRHLPSLGPGPGDPSLTSYPSPISDGRDQPPRQGGQEQELLHLSHHPLGFRLLRKGHRPARGYSPQLLLPRPAAASLGSVFPNCTSFLREWLPLLISCTPNVSQEGLPKQLVETVCQSLKS